SITALTRATIGTSNSSTAASGDVMSRISRRRFLQQSATVGAALAFSPLARAATSGSTNDKLNIGIIGLGWRGGEHMKMFGKLPNVRCAALCDVDTDLLDKAAQGKPDAKKYT